MAFVLYISIRCNDSSSGHRATIPKMLANSSPASTPSQLELSIPLCSSKKPTLGGSGGAVQERLVRRSGPRPNYTNLVHERLHYGLGSQVYTHLYITMFCYKSGAGFTLSTSNRTSSMNTVPTFSWRMTITSAC
jgi:hypothetical protein